MISFFNFQQNNDFNLTKNFFQYSNSALFRTYSTGSYMLRATIQKVVSMALPKVVFVLGGPGAGKSTQCQKIVKDFSFMHLSAGDLLREERSNSQSVYGKLIDTCIRDGKIVPVDITCSLLSRAMKESGQDKFLIDGFPRNKDNLDGWNWGVANNVNLLFVLYFECPLQVCTDRCLLRGAAGSGRSDDNIESLHKRINTYLSETKPIIEYYRDLNLIKSVDASKSADEVYDEVKNRFLALQAKGGDVGIL